MDTIKYESIQWLKQWQQVVFINPAKISVQWLTPKLEAAKRSEAETLLVAWVVWA